MNLVHRVNLLLLSGSVVFFLVTRLLGHSFLLSVLLALLWYLTLEILRTVVLFGVAFIHHALTEGQPEDRHHF